MTTVAEALASKPELAADLAAGLAVLSQNQQIVFQRYVKFTNPLDGFVFWLKDAGNTLTVNGSLHYATNTDQIEDETAGVNQVIFSSTQQVNDLNAIDPVNATNYAYVTGDRTATVTVTATTDMFSVGTVENLVNGDVASMGLTFADRALVPATDHLRFDFGSNTYINEATYYQDTTTAQGVWRWQGSWDALGWADIGSSFTLGGVAGGQVLAQLNSNAKNYRYYQLIPVSGSTTSATNVEQFEFKVGTVAAEYLYVGAIDSIEFAFNSRGRYYKVADLHHYVGTAVYPAFRSQLVEDPGTFDESSAVVSNSLPIWLSMNTYLPPYPGFTCPIPLYSSYLVPTNLVPPYGVVHIDPGSTEAVLGTPYLDQTLGHWQLATERVRVTLYGSRNSEAADFFDFVNQFSYDQNLIGLRGTPIMRDEKRTQSELTVLAMKKTIEFDVNYQQHAARSLARQLINNAIVSYLPQPQVAGDVTGPT